MTRDDMIRNAGFLAGVAVGLLLAALFSAIGTAVDWRALAALSAIPGGTAFGVLFALAGRKTKP